MMILHIDLERLIGACLNDPDLRMRILDALEHDRAPILTPCGYLTQDAKRFAVTLKTDRDSAPGLGGFVQCDSFGWIACRLLEAVAGEHDAKTVAADDMPTLRDAERGNR